MHKRYSCNRCNLESDRCQTIKDHLNRKIKCEGSLEAKLNTLDTFKCTDCDEDVNYKVTKKHLKTCKKEKPSTIINVTNNNNIINNNNTYIYIALNATETPSIEHIDKICSMIESRLPDLYKKIYFDKNVPNNHCILYTPEHEKNRTVGIIRGETQKFIDVKEDTFLDEIETTLNLAQDRLIDCLPVDQQFDVCQNVTKKYKERTSSRVVAERGEYLKIAKDNHQMVIDTIKSMP